MGQWVRFRTLGCVYHCLFKSCNFQSVSELSLDVHMKLHFESPGAPNIEPLVTDYEEPGRRRLTALHPIAASTEARLTAGTYHGPTASSSAVYSPAAHPIGGGILAHSEPLQVEYEEATHQHLTGSSMVAHEGAASFTMPTYGQLYATWKGGKFVCPVCPQAKCACIDDLRRHMRKHVPGARPYECPELACSYKGELGFYRKDKLTDHLRNRHGRNIPKKRGVYIPPHSALAHSSTASGAASGQTSDTLTR
ncbi:MAG: hypothetical protein FRX48_04558 [Lasallia pustulata]|uniref:C2H2-type domain-containing protein n=1 Tax=Lasallia pustulata TaxID=136370 RepID=A0A5M8PP39_9LECA|nr:MAG: hypothetical protein FRX48_04558 [Lasallia pustulata]